MHTFPLPAKSELEWTEWFKAYKADHKKMQHPDYSVPLAAVERWRTGPNGVSDHRLVQLDDLLKEMANVPPTPDQIVHRGMSWAGLQQKLAQTEFGDNKSLAPGCPFPEPEVTGETRPWLELLETGTFSQETLASIPVNFEVSDMWVGLLQRAPVEAGKTTWLHLLFLGTHTLEMGNVKAATEFFETSIVLKPSVHAVRNLAIIAPTKEKVVSRYQEAWAIWNDINTASDAAALQLGADLAGEICGWLLGNKQWDELEGYLDSLGVKPNSKSCLQKDRILHARAALAVHKGDFEAAISILRGNCFATYGHLRKDLLALWWTANKQKEASAKEGAALNHHELLALRKRLRCDGDQSQRRIDDACVCGPPNLGYAYGS